MILLIITILLAISVAAITCYNSWKNSSEEQFKKKNRIAVAFLIFAILTQGATFYNGYTAIQDKEISESVKVVKERENKVLSDSLRISQNKIISLQNDLLDTTNRILLTSLNSNQLQKKINGLQSELYNQVTGGDNRPVIGINICEDIRNDKNQIVRFTVFNQGKYPVKNLEFKIDDDNRAAKKVNFQKRTPTGVSEDVELDGSETKIEIFKGDIPPATYKDLYETKFISDLKYVVYFFEVQWQNGFYNGKIAFEKVEGTRDYKAYVIGAWDNTHQNIKGVIVYFPTKYSTIDVSSGQKK
jgi:hypothetical protein